MGNKFLIDFQKIIKHLKEQGLWVFMGRIYLMLISFSMSIILTKNLSVEGYGEYKYIYSVFALAAFFSLPEASQIVVRYVPRGYESIYDFLLKIRLKFSILGSIALLFYAIYVYYNSGDGLYYLLLAFIFLFYYPFNLFNPFLQAKLNYKFLNKLFVIRSTIQLLIVFIAVIVFKTAIAAILAFFISVAIINVKFFYLVRDRHIIKFKKSIKSIRVRKIFKRQTIILSFIGLLPIVAENIDKILIAKYIDYKSLAIFSIGLLIGKTVNGFFKPFLSTINAKLVNKTLEKRHYLALLIGGTILGVFLALVIIPKLIVFIYGEEYLGSIIYAKVVIASMGIYFMQTTYYNQNLFNKSNSLINIYVNNIITPIALILMMALFLYLPETIKTKLLLLSLLYPLKSILTIIIIYIFKKGKNRKKLLGSI